MYRKLFINALLVLALISIAAYIVVRAVLIGYGDYSGFDRLSALVLFLAEAFIIVHGAGYTINIFLAYHSQKRKAMLEEAVSKRITQEPSVAVLVAARHEPREVLEDTFISLKNLKYGNKDIYFLDDSSEEKYKREAEELSKELGVCLFRRAQRHGAKAGIVNDCIKTLGHKYVVLFDADQNPLPDFLKRLIFIMESDEKLAFVQTPQFYSNLGVSRVARAAAFQQAVFYEYICEGKSSQNAMFCCGTNIIFRRAALMAVGGLDESTVTEDFATSLKLHQSGWKSLYDNHVYAFGMAPENLMSYFKQQYRWANGTITVLKNVFLGFITRPFSLSLGQWWEYFLSGSYYMIGLAFFIMIMFPILYLLLKVPSFFAKPEVYALVFVPYIALSMSVFYFVLKTRHYKAKDLFLGQLLGSITFFVYVKAFLSSLAGIKTAFGITQKTKGAAIPYSRLLPQLVLISLTFAAVVWGVNRYFYERDTAIMINCFWAFYHFLILSSLFYFNEEPA